MRDKLKQFMGTRVVVEATFERYSGKKNAHDSCTTMLLCNVYAVGVLGGADFDNPVFISDHCWIEETKRIEKKVVHKGEKVRFTALVETYLKLGEHETLTDYRFKTLRGFRTIK